MHSMPTPQRHRFLRTGVEDLIYARECDTGKVTNGAHLGAAGCNRLPVARALGAIGRKYCGTYYHPLRPLGLADEPD